MFCEKTFIKAFAIITLAWLPYYVIKFPGSVGDDAFTQIRQFLGEMPLTTHHPLFSTVLMGGCIKIGELLGSCNFGVFLYTTCQYIVMAAIFSYCVKTVASFDISRLYPLMLLLFFALSPVFPSYATSMIKDSLFCALFCLYVLLLVLLVRDVKNKDLSFKNITVCAVLSFFLSVTRNNGIYSVVPTMILFVIFIISSKGINKKYSVIILAVPIIAFVGYNSFQYDILNIQKGKIAEALSIPFQQTARYVKTYPDEVTPEERAAIDSVRDNNYHKYRHILYFV